MPLTKLNKAAGDSDAIASSYDARPRLYLSDDLVEQLGLKGIPAPGTQFSVQAVAVAERVEASVEEPDEPDEGGKPDVSLCLVITDMSLSPTSTSPERLAATLYGGN